MIPKERENVQHTIGTLPSTKILADLWDECAFQFCDSEFQFLQLTSTYVLFTLLFNYNRQQSLLLLNFETLLFPENADLIVGEGGMVADLFMRSHLSLKTGGTVGGEGSLADSSNPLWLAQYRRFPNHACRGVCVGAML